MFLLSVAGQTVAIYVFLVALLGRLRRTALAELTPIGYLITALLGSAVETGLYRGSSSLAAGLVSAATLMVADYLFGRLLLGWPRLRRWLVGGPLVLVSNGRVLTAHLQRARLTEEDLKAAIRQRGFANLRDIRLAVLEVNGAVGVIPAEPDGG